MNQFLNIKINCKIVIYIIIKYTFLDNKVKNIELKECNVEKNINTENITNQYQLQLLEKYQKYNTESLENEKYELSEQYNNLVKEFKNVHLFLNLIYISTKLVLLKEKYNLILKMNN